ncbi:hypothetical protein V6N11_077161 [Hibiscus sabdariffa]|uniref:Uncharacterized protein n=1 Tax=Hibiscus sabdariffa TaxID=183260 RepID=A0ABR2TC92_9ROSI
MRRRSAGQPPGRVEAWVTLGPNALSQPGGQLSSSAVLHRSPPPAVDVCRLPPPYVVSRRRAGVHPRVWFCSGWGIYNGDGGLSFGHVVDAWGELWLTWRVAKAKG